MARATVRLLLLAAALSASCAPKLTSVALGNYELFSPFAVPRGARGSGYAFDVELERAGHIVILGLVMPTAAYDDRPVLFTPIYPLFETDPTFFEAGRHRVVPRGFQATVPRNCRSTETPRLNGCRRLITSLPGVHSRQEYDFTSVRENYLVLVSEEPLDAYALADELFFMMYERARLNPAPRDAPRISADELERVLLDRRGSPVWAGLLVTQR